MTLQSTGFTPASTISKSEADQAADQLLTAHWEAQREVAAAQALLNTATAALEAALTARGEALQRLSLAQTRADQFRREAYVGAQRALSYQPPGPTAEEMFPLANGGIAKVLPQPGGELDRARQAAAPRPGGAFFEAQAAATPGCGSMTAEQQAETNYHHALTLWQIQGHKPGEEPKREAYGLKPLPTNEPAASPAKTEQKR